MLAVPEGAIIDTGRQKIVYRQALPGEFEGVLVQLGPRMVGPNDVTFFPVLSGLEAGELIVTRGSFLVDAETRLNPAAGSIYIGGSSGGGSTPSKTVRPSTPEDTDAKIDLALAKLSPADRKLAASQKFCPILTESRLGSMGVPIKVMVKDQLVFVCCNGCTKQAAKEADATLKKVADLRAHRKPEGEKKLSSSKPTPKQEKIAKALAKLAPEDRAAAEKQNFCAVMPKSELGSMGTPIKLVRDGQPLFLCGEGCLAAALEKWPTAKRADTLPKTKVR